MSKNQITLVKGVEAQESQTYQNLVQIAFRRVSFIVLGVVFGVGLGTLYYFIATPKYESQAQVVVIKKHSGTPDTLATATGDSSRSASAEDYLATHASIIHSPVVVGRALAVIKKQKPDALAWYEKRARRNDTDLLREVVDAIVVRRDTKDVHNNTLELSFRTTQRDECTLVLEEVLKSYQQFLHDNYQNVSEKTVELIVRATDLLHKELKDKEAAYQEFRRQTPVALYKGKEGTTFSHEHLLNLTGKKLDYQVRRAEIAQRLAAIDKALQNGASRDELISMVSSLTAKSISVPDQNGRTNATWVLEDKLLPALMEEKMLLEEYGPRHPQVLAAHKRVELAQRYATEALRQEMNDLALSERSVGGSLNEEFETAKKAIAFEVQDEAFRKDIERVQQLYNDTVKRLEEVNIVKDLGGFDAQPIQAPTVGKQVWPRGILLFPAAAFLGLVMGFGLAYLVDITDKSFRTAEEIRRRLECQVIAHIPQILPDTALAQKAEARGVRLKPTLVTYYKPKSRLAEAFRGVRTALYFSSEGQGHRVIQVTSANPGEGKSTLAANLAVSIARSGKRVVLVDADLRRPTVHDNFGLENAVGLASYGAGKADLAQVLQPTPVKGLSVITSGPIPANPAELLTSPRFKELLDTLREGYDFVIVDTPPLLAVTDPAVVAPRVDGVILTLRITKKSRPDAERSKEILNTLGVKVIGVVVNGQEVKSGYGGYGYSSYNYNSEKYNYDGEGYYHSADSAESDDLDDGEAHAVAEAPEVRAPSAGRFLTDAALSDGDTPPRNGQG
jgi:capsular exopolysaccharide synthesis family protein